MARRIRKTSPNAIIIIQCTWSGENNPEGQIRADLETSTAARRNNLHVIYGGDAMHLANIGRPELDLWRPHGGGHQGYLGIYAMSCTAYALMTNQNPVGLPEKFLKRSSYGHDPKYIDKSSDGGKEARVVFKMEKDVAKYLQEVAWRVHQGERAGEVVKKDEAELAQKADMRVLLIGNSYADFSGITYKSLAKCKFDKKKTIYTKTLAETGSTFASHYLNDKGTLTLRQKNILAQIKTRKNGVVCLEVPEGNKFGLDYMGDYVESHAEVTFLQHKGTMDGLLTTTKWDHILLQSYRETDSTTEFEKYGKLLIEKIRKNAPQAKISLLMSWPFADKSEEFTINGIYFRKLFRFISKRPTH
jgi:hypothetical protein